jgi:hypothetical protein
MLNGAPLIKGAEMGQNWFGIYSTASNTLNAPKYRWNQTALSSFLKNWISGHPHALTLHRKNSSAQNKLHVSKLNTISSQA